MPNQTNKKSNPKTPTNPKNIKRFWQFYGIAIASIFLFFIAMSMGLLTDMPTFEDLENPNNALATEVYSADSTLLGKIYIENRSYTKYEELSPNVVNALIATEDARFYEHSGIDFKALMRAVFLAGTEGGASTLTQQLAKNLYSKRNANFAQRIFQKFKEWIIATKLERNYTKQELIAIYLNTVSFGKNAFGIATASKVYFSTTPEKLSTDQAAMLIGLLKGSTYYSPIRHPERAMARRNTVIDQMNKYNYIDQNTAQNLKTKPLNLKLKTESHYDGMATYFREYLKTYLKKWGEENRKPDGQKYNVFTDGLKIYTTIDSKMQRYAEETMKEHMKALQATFNEHWKGRNPWDTYAGDKEYTQRKNYLAKSMKRSDWWQYYEQQGLSSQEIINKFNVPVETTLFSWKKGKIDTTLSLLDSIKHASKILHIGFMAMNPQTAEVKAWVGGIDMETFQYDHVNPEARRQVGSTFKPFVYARAIMEGIPPCQGIPNERIRIGGWYPENSENRYGGYLNMFQGLSASVNMIVIRLIKQIGYKPVIELARSMGITSPLPEDYTISLGTADLSVYEMVGAYGTFANKGVWQQPTFIKRIEDHKGNVLQDFTPVSKEAMSEEVAYAMCKIMQSVIKNGTGKRITNPTYGGITTPLSGKTGTTQDNTDGWFMCYSPEIVCGAWVGGDERIIRFRSTALGQGANSALPMVGKFLRKCYDDKKLGYTGKDFEPPKEKPNEQSKIITDCSKFGGSRSPSSGNTNTNNSADELFNE